MGYVFVSHSSSDKLAHVRPLVHALALEGVGLWVDRPGHGDSHLGFDQAFIERYGIRGLRTGLPWNEQIADALRDCDAVLLCVSRQLLTDRQVLNQEVAIAWQAGKIVACVVDDLRFDEIPADLGLPDFQRMQMQRIDTAGLQRCLDWLAHHPQSSPRQLPESLRSPWEGMLKLRADVAGLTQSRAPMVIPTAVPELDLCECGVYQMSGGMPIATFGCLLRNQDVKSLEWQSVRATVRAVWDLPVCITDDQYPIDVPLRGTRVNLLPQPGFSVSAELDQHVSVGATSGFRLTLFSRKARNALLDEGDLEEPWGSMLFWIDLELQTDGGRLQLPSVVADLCGFNGGSGRAMRLSVKNVQVIEQRIGEIRAALAHGALIDPELLVRLGEYERTFRPRVP